MEPMTMPAMAPPLNVDASFGLPLGAVTVTVAGGACRANREARVDLSRGSVVVGVVGGISQREREQPRL